MICKLDQIKNIIINNPNKEIINFGKIQAEKLMLHLYGKGLKESFKQITYFENKDTFESRILAPTSNKDLFARLLQREEMVFTAHGGETYYNKLNDTQTKTLNSKLDSIRFGMNLRSWIKQFALQAYRSDPMGLIYIEIDKENNIYPTYKCISNIYDYQNTGRQIEYVCFQLTKKDAIGFGINDRDLDRIADDRLTQFFRFVDDAFDTIYKRVDNNINIVAINGKESITNIFKKVPAFVVSDIIAYNNIQIFISPLDFVIELADTYQNDRSVRDLQKKYVGFLKSIEPLLTCGTCNGTGFLSSGSCPDCTPPGADRGTGFKLQTKVSDVARFSLDNLKEGFDYRKIFGYVDVPITVWNKQDTSLNDIENMMTAVYWGTDLRSTTTSGPDINAKNIEETATKTLANLQPVYARLNRTADWAQKTENMIVDFIGFHEFPEQFKKSSITYGRYYILETPITLMDEYLNIKKEGASQVVLNEALKKYYHSQYKDNPTKLAVMIKMMDVEPFIHHTIVDIYAGNVAKEDYISKLYFNEWFLNQEEDYLLTTKKEVLSEALKNYALEKDKLETTKPINAAPPSVAVSERVITG